MIQITRTKSVPVSAVLPYAGLLAVLLVAAATWYFGYLPAERDREQLSWELSMEQQMSGVLQAAIARRPALEAQLQQLRVQWQDEQVFIPGPFDGVATAEFVQDRIGVAGIGRGQTSFFYEPVRFVNDRYYMPLQWEAKSTYAAIQTALADLQRRFPSLALDDVTLGPAENGLIEVRVYGRLLLFGAKSETTSWRPQMFDPLPVPVQGAPFGPRFEVLRSFYERGPIIAGVIITDAMQRVLVRLLNGDEVWMQLGDVLGPGFIAEIRRSSVVINVGGLLLELGIGGR